MSEAQIILIFVTASRLFGWMLSRRHERAMRAKGAFEVGAAHYPAFVALHAGWLAGLFMLAADAPVSTPWLIVFLILQAAQIWTLVSLGERWTTRIMILPDEPLVTAGPYRFVRHPHYMIVSGEIAVLPLTFGLQTYALFFSIANAMVLAVRIEAEDNALGRGIGSDI